MELAAAGTERRSCSARLTMATGVGLFSWGTPLSLLLLVFAFGTACGLRGGRASGRAAFPGFGRWMPMPLGFGRTGARGLRLTVLLATLRGPAGAGWSSWGPTATS